MAVLRRYRAPCCGIAMLSGYGAIAVGRLKRLGVDWQRDFVKAAWLWFVVWFLGDLVPSFSTVLLPSLGPLRHVAHLLRGNGQGVAEAIQHVIAGPPGSQWLAHCRPHPELWIGAEHGGKLG